MLVSFLAAERLAGFGKGAPESHTLPRDLTSSTLCRASCNHRNLIFHKLSVARDNYAGRVSVPCSARSTPEPGLMRRSGRIYHLNLKLEETKPVSGENPSGTIVVVQSAPGGSSVLSARSAYLLPLTRDAGGLPPKPGSRFPPRLASVCSTWVNRGKMGMCPDGVRTLERL